jgi:hypothetical protein
MRTALAAVLAIAASPAWGQDGAPQGIGFAQAEEGTWLCRHERVEEALACARELCAEQSPGQTCWATAWCLPANWSGVMTIWLGDFHTNHVLCGAPSEAALEGALQAICAGDQSATYCDVILIVDPEGNERQVEGVRFAGPAAAAAEATAVEPGGDAPELEDVPGLH